LWMPEKFPTSPERRGGDRSRCRQTVFTQRDDWRHKLGGSPAKNKKTETTLKRPKTQLDLEERAQFDLSQNPQKALSGRKPFPSRLWTESLGQKSRRRGPSTEKVKGKERPTFHGGKKKEEGHTIKPQGFALPLHATRRGGKKKVWVRQGGDGTGIGQFQGEAQILCSQSLKPQKTIARQSVGTTKERGYQKQKKKGNEWNSTMGLESSRMVGREKSNCLPCGKRTARPSRDR